MSNVDIPKTGWIKYWEAPLKPIFSFFGVRLGHAEKYIDESLGYEMFLIDYKNGVTSGYYQESDLERFQEQAVLYIQREGSFDQLESESDDTIRELQRLLNTAHYSKEDVLSLQKLFDWMHIFTGIIKTLGDAAVSEEVFSKILSLRKKTEKVYFDLGTTLMNIATQIAEDKGISIDETATLSYMDVLAYFETGALPSREILQRRSERTVLFVTKEGFNELSDAEYEPIFAEINRQSSSDTLQGQTGCKGKVRARASVIIDFSSGADMPEGNVLVTGMTDPRFVPIMKKASAIVTDAGGMLCHAAIVSRELGKPCVIGTRVATQAIKDGDLVEVDADKGEIRIVERARG